jgi:hypothetical protein
MLHQRVDPEPLDVDEPGADTGLMRMYLAGVLVFLTVLHISLLFDLFGMLREIF